MRSSTVAVGDQATAAQYNNLRKDAFGAAFLLAHEQSSPDLTLYVEAGVCYVGATRVIFAGGNSPSFTAPSANPRIDLLTIDSSGTIARTAGSEAASPSVPTYPADKLVIAEVYCRVSQTTIRDSDQGSNGYIKQDVRPFLGGSYIASNAQVAVGANIAPSKLDSGNVDADWLPDADGTRKLGSSSRRWSELRAVTLYGDGSNLTGLAPSRLTNASLIAGQALAQNDALFIEDSTTFDTSQIITTTATNLDPSQGIGVTTTTGTKGKRVAQKFTTTTSFTANKIIAYLAKVGSPGDSLTISIQADAAGVPSGTDLASGTISGATLTTSSAGYTITMGTPYTLSASTSYWVVATRTGALSDTDYYRNSSGIYSGDTLFVQSSANAWAVGTDMKVWHIEVVESSITGKVYKTTAATAGRYERFVGFANAAYNLGDTVTLVHSGVINTMSGLTVGSQYYLSDTLGAISTSPGSNTRKVGISLSATELLINNIW